MTAAAAATPGEFGDLKPPPAATALPDTSDLLNMEAMFFDSPVGGDGMFPL